MEKFREPKKKRSFWIFIGPLLFIVCSILVLWFSALSKQEAMIPGFFSQLRSPHSPSISELITQSKYDVTISIDEVIAYSDGYFVKGRITQANLANGTLFSVDESQIQLFDSSGAQIPIQIVQFDTYYLPDSLTFGFYAQTSAPFGQLTLVIPKLTFHYQNNSSSFSVPEIPVNTKSVQIGKQIIINGHKFLIDRVRLVKNEYSQSSSRNIDSVIYSFYFSADKNIESILLDSTDSTENGPYTPLNHDTDYSYVILEKQLLSPNSPITEFSIKGFIFSEKGNWRVSWDPQEYTQSRSSRLSDLANICIPDPSKVETYSDDLDSNPTPLGGTLLLLSNKNKNISLLNLPDFSNLLTLTSASSVENANLSPNSEIIAYSSDQQIVLMDVQTREERFFPLSSYQDGPIIFSKDSGEVTFSTFNYIQQIDLTTGILSLINKEGSPLIFVSDWVEEGRRLIGVEVFLKAGGGSLVYYDLLLGEVTDISNVEFSTIWPFFSPDGQHLAFSDYIIGTRSMGIIVSDRGFSDRHLLSMENENTRIVSAVWSPDSKWMILSFDEYQNDRYINILVNPFSCEQYLLPLTDGYVTAWR